MPDLPDPLSSASSASSASASPPPSPPADLDPSAPLKTACALVLATPAPEAILTTLDSIARGNTKKSHAKKQPQGHIPRPRNAFILFRCVFVCAGQVPASVEKDHRNISRIAGSVWKAMPKGEKQPWERAAELEKERHERKWPGYRYNPANAPPPASTTAPMAIPPASTSLPLTFKPSLPAPKKSAPKKRAAAPALSLAPPSHADSKCEAIARLVRTGKNGGDLEAAVRALPSFPPPPPSPTPVDLVPPPALFPSTPAPPLPVPFAPYAPLARRSSSCPPLPQPPILFSPAPEDAPEGMDPYATGFRAPPTHWGPPPAPVEGYTFGAPTFTDPFAPPPPVDDAFAFPQERRMSVSADFWTFPDAPLAGRRTSQDMYPASARRASQDWPLARDWLPAPPLPRTSQDWGPGMRRPSQDWNAPQMRRPSQDWSLRRPSVVHFLDPFAPSHPTLERRPSLAPLSFAPRRRSSSLDRLYASSSIAGALVAPQPTRVARLPSALAFEPFNPFAAGSGGRLFGSQGAVLDVSEEDEDLDGVPRTPADAEAFGAVRAWSVEDGMDVE